jgi:hypothetical protein
MTILAVTEPELAVHAANSRDGSLEACAPVDNSLVMAGHSRSKNGVASLAYARPSTSLQPKKDVDARVKPAHDRE